MIGPPFSGTVSLKLERGRLLSRRRALFRFQARKPLLVLLSALLAWPATGGIAQGPVVRAQEEEVNNPFADDPGALIQGRTLFRMVCGVCHGLDGKGGGRGPDLTLGRWEHGDSDAALSRTIRNGVPGTEMPSYLFGDNDREIWMIISFLRTLGEGSRPPVSGDRAAGKKIFFVKSKCSQCHMIQGKGGRFGPDLSRVGSTRSGDYLAESIREPNKKLPPQYQTVSVVTRDGKRITGVRKNEDTFSLQLMSPDEQLHLFLKRDLEKVITESHSLMPAYDRKMLSEQELEDLVAYLDGLRGK